MIALWEYRTDFEKCLNPLFTDIAINAYHGKSSTDGLAEKATACLERFFQVMKGTINITSDDIVEALDWASKVEEDFYTSLWNLVDLMPKHIEVIPPDRVYSDPYWDTGLIPGCNIKAGECYLHATPRIPAATSCWMALVQEPVAASILTVKNDCVLMLPSGQYPTEGFIDALKEISGEQKDVTQDFESAYNARVQSGYLYIDSNNKLDTETLNESLQIYNVGAVVKVNLSQQTGFIYTGTEENLPELQRKVYYEWHEKWKVYNN